MPDEAPQTGAKETWLNWWPRHLDPPPEDTWITRDQLLEELKRTGTPLALRTLRHWEAIGRLPRPVRRWREQERGMFAMYPQDHASLVRWVIRGLSAGGPEAFREMESASHLRRWMLQRAEISWFYFNERAHTLISELLDLYESARGERPAGGILTLMDAQERVLQALPFAGRDLLTLPEDEIDVSDSQFSKNN